MDGGVKHDTVEGQTQERTVRHLCSVLASFTPIFIYYKDDTVLYTIEPILFVKELTLYLDFTDIHIRYIVLIIDFFHQAPTVYVVLFLRGYWLEKWLEKKSYMK